MAMLALATSSSTSAQAKPSKKELRQQKEVEELLETINSRNFRVEISTVVHALNGSQIDLNIFQDRPVVLFRQDGIHFSVPYFTGNAPLDGVSGNENLGLAYGTLTGGSMDKAAQLYPTTWLDWVSPYPQDYKVTAGKGEVTISFTTSMGDSNSYLCEFGFSRKNCDFTIDCKSFTKTQYRGSIIDEN